MSSHVKTSDNPSESVLFSTLNQTFLPYYDGMEQLQNAAVCLLENVKGQCDIASDFATASACDPYAVVEFKARSLVSQYDNLSNQVGAAIELIEADTVQCSRLQREKDQLQKRLFSMERELSKTLEINTKYYAYIQELEGELSIDANTDRGFES